MMDWDWVQKMVIWSAGVFVVTLVVFFAAWAIKSSEHPVGMTTINAPTDPSAYRYENQAAVCNSLRYMNVILMDEEARLACRLASDGRPGFRIAEFWEKMREAGR